MLRRAVFLATLLAVAAPATAAPDDQLSTLTASGEGKVQVRPDVAIVTLGVVSEAPNAKAALAANSSDMTNVTAAIRAAGVADADIATSGFSVSPVYSQQRPRQDGIEPAKTAYQPFDINTARRWHRGSLQRRWGELLLLLLLIFLLNQQ